MKILVTGSQGQLGKELYNVLEQRAPGITTYVDLTELDITDAKAVDNFLATGEFTHIINCAAYTAVDRAEEEKLQCARVNVDGISNLARNAERLDLRIIHISTDYIFDGKSCRPYTESAKPEPLNVYGSTKRKGETALLGLAPSSMIIRTGWLYSPYGHNFVKTILERADNRLPLRVVVDQVGTPTYAADLAEAIADIVLRGHWTPGIFNYTNEGVASWYDLAVAVLTCAGKADRARAVVPVMSAEYVSAATRPYFSVLDKSKIKATFGITIPHWHDALSRCIDRITNSNNP